jgi:hypothetical protein
MGPTIASSIARDADIEQATEIRWAICGEEPRKFGEGRIEIALAARLPA